MPVLQFIYRRFFNSVPFGIVTMAAIGLYIALGSGFPQVREWFEMDELLFFNAWPLKLLMALLVINLAMVTVTRIPLTPPRYGVWMIHLGIILLVISTSAYYSRKVEGLVRVWKPQFVPGGAEVVEFFDRWERALYVTVEDENGRRVSPRMGMATLPSLPRFRAYTEAAGDSRYLDRADLRKIELGFDELQNARDSRSGTTFLPIGRWIGLSAPLTADIVEYYPYGEVVTDFVPDPAAGRVGLTLQQVETDHTGHNHGTETTIKAPAGLASWDAENGRAMLGGAELEHRHLPTGDDVQLLLKAASRLHRLNVRLGEAVNEEIFIEPGQTISLGQTGYRLTMEGFDVSHPLQDGSGFAPRIALKVQRAGAAPIQFRRYVVQGRDKQADFPLDAAGNAPVGPMAPTSLDSALQVTYSFNDKMELYPRRGGATRHLLITTDDSNAVTYMRIDGTTPAIFDRFENGRGGIVIDARESDPAVSPQWLWHPRNPLGPTIPIPGGTIRGRAVSDTAVLFERHDKLSTVQRVLVEPPEKRNRQAAQAGIMQVVKVRLQSGDWTRDVYVPFRDFPLPDFAASEPVPLPGTSARLRFTLGNRKRDMPVRIRLEGFEAIPYAGAPIDRAQAFRDFRSDLLLTDRATGRQWKASTQLNSPAFLPGGVLPWPFDESWLLYQAQWDPQGQRFTVLGVGNRPAVGVMAMSCVLIATGLLYAFYLKPIIIRRMKQGAIAAAQQRRPRKSEQLPVVANA